MRYAKVYFEEIGIGDEMPALAKPPIQQIQLTRYAGASGDFNPIHQDDAFAKAAGMGGVFAHGMLSMGFAAQSVTDWLGVGTVQKIGVRFAGLVRLGDVITCRGKVIAKRAGKDDQAPGLVELELWAENQKGEKVVTGRATAAIPSRGPSESPA
jgi:acyl dehydratase